MLRIALLLAMTGMGAVLHTELKADEPQAKTKAPSGYTVTVEFLVDSKGKVSNAKVVESEAKQLNEYALAMVESGRLNPKSLPGAGEEPRIVSAPLFFPVEDYAGNQPLPEGVTKPVPVEMAPPRYPFEYRKAGIVGGVLVAITVGADGRVKACNFPRLSHPHFAREVQAALKRWKFTPAMRGDQPVEITVNMAFCFEFTDRLRPSQWQWLVAPEPHLLPFVVGTVRDYR